MKVAQLKDVCKERQLPTQGKKAELQQRIRDSYGMEAKKKAQLAAGVEETPPADDYESMSAEDLKDALRSRGLNTRGKKPTLIKRLREDSESIHELMQSTPQDQMDALVSVLEAATKESATLRQYAKDKKLADKAKKFVNVTITSLELVPEKYTAGGAPSVTADVLRKLAGDPFADPPKYGSVSSPDRQKRRFALILRC